MNENTVSPDLIDVRNTATRRGKGKKEKIEKMSESFALRPCSDGVMQLDTPPPSVNCHLCPGSQNRQTNITGIGRSLFCVKPTSLFRRGDINCNFWDHGNQTKTVGIKKLNRQQG
jgi:hypothetical protein